MELNDDVVATLAELAAIAGGYGLSEPTEAMVDALVALRPDSERPFLIRALARLNVEDASGAERILRDQVLSKHPESRMGLALLGVALSAQGRIGERDRVLEQALASPDDDEDATQLARALLESAPV